MLLQIILQKNYLVNNMKYILRIIVSIPILCVEISMLILFTISFDYPLCTLLVIGDAIATITLLAYFEALVRELKEFVNIIVKDCYNE